MQLNLGGSFVNSNGNLLSHADVSAAGNIKSMANLTSSSYWESSVDTCKDTKGTKNRKPFEDCTYSGKRKR